MRLKKFALACFLLIVFASLVSASFEVGNQSHFIETTYGPESEIEGWVNISFTDQAITSSVGGNFGNSVTLEEFLDSNPSAQYSCNPSDCSINITSEFIILNLDGLGFVVPEDFDTYDFTLDIEGEEIFTEQIEVKDAPTINSLNPLEASVGFATEFEINVSSNFNISSYEWDFGDGSNLKTSFVETTTHTFSDSGTFSVKVTAIDSEGTSSSKTFSVEVGSAEDLVQNLIAEKRLNINKIKQDISGLNVFLQNGIKGVLNLDNIETEVNSLEQEYNNATSESQYSLIANDLNLLNVPDGIVNTEQATNVVFFVDKDNIDLSSFPGVSDYSSKRAAYQDATLGWQTSNVEVLISFNSFARENGDITTPLVNFFDVSLFQTGTFSHEYYLVVPKLNYVEFDSSVADDLGSYYSIPLSGDSAVSFFTSEDYDFTNVPIFIAPPVSALVLNEELVEPIETSGSGFTILLAIILLLIIALIIYIVLQEWYKRRYESYLFKDRNDLYNMVHYVNSAKKKGLKNNEIEKNLRKAGWSSERVRYVMRKYAGKRTGMFELPIGKVINKFEKKEKDKGKGSGPRGPPRRPPPKR